MKLSRNTTYLLYAALLMAPATVMAQNCHEVKLADNKIQVSNVQVAQQNNALTVSMDLNLDSLNLPTNTQLYILLSSRVRSWNISCLRLSSTENASRLCMNVG